MSALLPAHDPVNPAIVDADEDLEVRYDALRARVEATARALRDSAAHDLVFLLATNRIGAIVAYLACLDAGYPVVLLDAAMPADRLDGLVAAYAPAAIIAPVATPLPAACTGVHTLPCGTFRIGALRAGTPACHDRLALLLTTSGSTGNPKLVRLTLDNVLSNARSIADYLGIEPGERSIQSLPMHYSYGLSLVNSHLVAGATVVLSAHSFLRPEFWRAFDSAGCTSFSSVPYTYETLHRLRFDPAKHPRLRTLTQAGGPLRADLVRTFWEKSRAAGARFFVMYGQTEAAPRIAYVPHDRLGEKIGAIGIAIPGGTLSLAPVDGSDQHELVYRGPNVMMGYAQSRADLAAGDLLHGTLRTGDLARVDADGFYTLTGRLSRFAKLFGRRVNLEDVEREIETRFPLRVVAAEGDGQLVVHAAPRFDDAQGAAIAQHLAAWLSVPVQCVRLRALDEIPLTANGKKDYRALS